MLKRLLPLLLLFSCQKALTPQEEQIDRFAKEINQKVQAKCKLKLTHINADSKDEINHLDITYSLRGLYSVDEARVMMVNCMEEVYQSINCNDAMKPYLKKLPFERYDLRINISFPDGFNQNPHNDPSAPLFYVLVCKNNIIYCTDSVRGPLNDVRKEKYEDAYWTVYDEKVSIPPYIEEKCQNPIYFIMDESLGEQFIKQRYKHITSHYSD